jgi:hypothetical protein
MKESRDFDLEERLIDFAVRVTVTNNQLISIFVASIKTAKQNQSKTS